MRSIDVLFLYFISSATAFHDIETACGLIAKNNYYLFAHKINPSQYWICLNNEVTLGSCSEGYHFDEIVQSCKFSKDYDREKYKTTPNILDNDYEYDYENKDYTSATTPNILDNDYEYDYETEDYTSVTTLISTFEIIGTQSTQSPCSNVPEGKIVLQKAQFSWTYRKCVGATYLNLNCPPDFFFNEERQLCDISPDTDFLKLANNDPKCANTSIAYLPHSFDCNKFVKCYLNQSYELLCPSGFHFDKNEKKCKHSDNVDCMVDTRCNDNREFVKFLPHPTSCTKFIECYNYGHVSYVRECKSGFIFSTKQQNCISMSRSGPDDCVVTEPPWTTPENVCSNVREGETVLKRCDDACEFYWECKGTSQYLKRCPENLFFNEEYQFCSATSNCGNFKKLFAWTIQPFLTQRSVYKHPMCINNNFERNTFFSHPSDCRKFVECVNSDAVERKCPEGLYFDSASKRCTTLTLSLCS